MSHMCIYYIDAAGLWVSDRRVRSPALGSCQPGRLWFQGGTTCPTRLV